MLVEGVERAQRRQVIVKAARGLAESEGWEAVTTRRLADRIDLQPAGPLQPFRGQRRHRERSSLEGFGELAALLHNANKRARSLAAKQRAVANTYIKGSRFDCR